MSHKYPATPESKEVFSEWWELTKRHRNHLERATIHQIWDNLLININYDSKRVYNLLNKIRINKSIMINTER